MDLREALTYLLEKHGEAYFSGNRDRFFAISDKANAITAWRGDIAVGADPDFLLRELRLMRQFKG